MEYYLALQRSEILIHAAAWMNLEDILLSEIRQTQIYKYCKIPVNMRYLEYLDT